MGPVRGTFAILIALAVPWVASAQPAPLPAKPVPPAKPAQPIHHPPRPGATGSGQRPAYRPGYGYGYWPVSVDSSVVNQLIKPAPTPAPAHQQATPRPKNAPDVFGTHSTSDAQ